MTDCLRQKRDALYDILRLLGGQGLIVCYSGGCDSTLLAAAAQQAQIAPLLLLTFTTPTTSRYDLDAAAETAAGLRLPQRVRQLDTLAIPEVAGNSRDRCYHCKLALYREALLLAHLEGYGCVVDGGNAEDRRIHRPGNRAVDELGVRQPLAEAGLDKTEIRHLAAQMGLPNFDRPASPCLASRFPYDTQLNPTLLARVEQGENLLRDLGLQHYRLRCHDDLVRIEVAPEEATLLLRQKDQVNSGLQALGFRYITLDLQDLTSGRFDRA